MNKLLTDLECHTKLTTAKSASRKEATGRQPVDNLSSNKEEGILPPRVKLTLS